MIKLFIATSLDGYIARKDGALDWLNKIPAPEGEDYGYGEFMKNIDTVVMGRKTYEEVLGFDVEWPYGNCNTVVYSSNRQLDLPTPKTSLEPVLNETSLKALKEMAEKDIWVVGGGQLIKHFMDMDAIDEVTLSLIPVVLGGGLPLFPPTTKETNLKLLGTTPFETGVVNLRYAK